MLRTKQLRPQDKWKHSSDNSVLTANPDEKQIFSAHNFAEQFQDYHKERFQRFLKYLASPFTINRTINQVIDDEDGLSAAIEELNRDEYVIVQVYNQLRTSYKGYISWLMLANSNYCCIVDCIALHDIFAASDGSNQSMKKILEDAKIIKLAINCAETTSSLKRDFNIFAVNIFELVYLEHYHLDLGKLREEMHLSSSLTLQLQPRFKHHLPPPEYSLVARPMPKKLLALFQKNLEVLFEYCLRIPKKPLNTFVHSSQQQISQQNYHHWIGYHYAEINSCEFIIAPYQHAIRHCFSKKQLGELPPKAENLYYLLIELREHMARMNDVSVEIIIPDLVLEKIVTEGGCSVLEISGLYEEYGKVNVGMEICKRIYDLIELNVEKMEDADKLKTEILQRPDFFQNVGGKEKPDPFNIKKVLKEIGWGDSSQWLNRKDDPSIKLYKQIISIDQFDDSIGEKYIEAMKGEVIRKKDLGKFLKYGQYMRNQNYEKLEKYYKDHLNSSDECDESQEKNDEKQDQDIRSSNRSLFQQQSTFPSKANVHSATSLTTPEEGPTGNQVNLKPTILKPFHKSQHFSQSAEEVENSENSRSRKSSDSESKASSIKISDLDDMHISRADIKALPDSIEQVYGMALEVKKRMERNSESKKKEKNKGKGKGKVESERESEFVPTWEDIKKVLMMNPGSSVK